MTGPRTILELVGNALAATDLAVERAKRILPVEEEIDSENAETLRTVIVLMEAARRQLYNAEQVAQAGPK